MKKAARIALAAFVLIWIAAGLLFLMVMVSRPVHAADVTLQCGPLETPNPALPEAFECALPERETFTPEEVLSLLQQFANHAEKANERSTARVVDRIAKRVKPVIEERDRLREQVRDRRIGQGCS